MATCRSCGEDITWCVTTNGKMMPVDALPADDGKFYLVEEGDTHPTAYYFNDMFTPLDADFDGERYDSHFATCDYADSHRNPR